MIDEVATAYQVVLSALDSNCSVQAVRLRSLQRHA